MQNYVWHTVVPLEKKPKRKREDPVSKLPDPAPIESVPSADLDNQLGSVCMECFGSKVKCSRRSPCERCLRKGLSCVPQGRGRGRPRKSYEDLSTANVVHSLCTRPASFIRKSWNRFTQSLTEFVSSVLGNPEDEVNQLTYQQKLSMLTSVAGFVSMRQQVLQNDRNEHSCTDDWVQDRSSLFNMILQVWTIISKGTRGFAESLSESKAFQGLPACPDVLRERDLSWLPVPISVLSGSDPLHITLYVLGKRRQVTTPHWNQTFFTTDETDAATLACDKMKSGPLGRLQLFSLYHILPKTDHAGFVQQYSNRFFSDFTNEEYDSAHGKICMFVSLNKTTGACVDRAGQTLQGSLWIYNFVGYGGKLFGQVIRFVPSNNAPTVSESASIRAVKLETKTDELNPRKRAESKGKKPGSVTRIKQHKQQQRMSVSTSIAVPKLMNKKQRLVHGMVDHLPIGPSSGLSEKRYDYASAIAASTMAAAGFMSDPQSYSINERFAMPMIVPVANVRPVCTSGNTVELPAGYMHKLRPGYISQHQFLQDISRSQHLRKPFSEFTPADLACLTNQQAAQLATQLSIAHMTNAPPHMVSQLNAGVSVETSRYFSNFSTCVLTDAPHQVTQAPATSVGDINPEEFQM